MKQNLFITFIFIFLIHGSAVAANYVVRDVKVDVEAKSAIEARNNALNKARRVAFNVLSTRLLNANEKKSISTASDNDIASMVDSFEINREKQSKNRYLASVNVTFNERAVQTYLGRYSNVGLPDSYYDTPLPNKEPVQQHPSNTRQQYEQTFQNNINAIPYKMKVDLRNIRQWVTIQKTLEAVGNISINSISSNRAVVTLLFSGDASHLQQSLNMKGMQLYSNSNMPNPQAPYTLMVKG